MGSPDAYQLPARPAPAELQTVGLEGLPALIAAAGERAARRFLEFFTATIRNPNTRAAYARAAAAFLAWCEERGITDLRQVQPVVVAAYVEQLTGERSARNRCLKPTPPPP